MTDSNPQRVLERIVEKVAEHVRAWNGERPTHVMLPPAEAEEVREWMYANPTAMQPADGAIGQLVGRNVAGLIVVEGEEFKVWYEVEIDLGSEQLS